MPGKLVDIHHHLLYETDDGPADFNQSVRMLHRAAEQGVRCIVATPHIFPGRVEYEPVQHRQKLDALREYVLKEKLEIELIGSAEVFYNSSVSSYLENHRIPMLGNSWHMLVEFHPNTHYDLLRKAALTISNMGYDMVLAHAERYCCLRVKGRIERLQSNLGVKIQLNSDSVIAAHCRFGDRWVRRLLREGLVDIVASDAHNTDARPCTLGDCMKLLSEEYGMDMARRLCIDHPLALLNEKSSLRSAKNPEETKL